MNAFLQIYNQSPTEYRKKLGSREKNLGPLVILYASLKPLKTLIPGPKLTFTYYVELISVTRSQILVLAGRKLSQTRKMMRFRGPILFSESFPGDTRAQFGYL
jgi:hypothetical protein